MTYFNIKCELESFNIYSNKLIFLSITAAFASIGSAGIPAGATLALLASLNALNIPVREISIFISLDWLMYVFLLLLLNKLFVLVH
jgi:Na+/H+-dicarboxylate symporter